MAVLVLSGCVGPARTTHTYESKAVRTANDSLSELQTALLSVNTSLHGRLMHAYLVTVLSESEDAFSSIQNTFARSSRRIPPELISFGRASTRCCPTARTGWRNCAILARRQDTAGLAALAHKLTATAAELAKFAQERG